LNRKRDRFVLMFRAEHVKQWQVMIRSRNREQGVASESLVVNERIKLAVNHQLACDSFKTYGPVVRLRCVHAPGVSVQVVDQVAAANDQDLFFTQWSQTFSDLKVKTRRLRLID